MSTAITLGALERGARCDGPLGVARPRGPEDLAALGLRPGARTPAWVVIARPSFGATPRLAAAEVEGAPALVLTWVLPRPGEGQGQGLVATCAWHVDGPVPLRLLVRAAADEAAAASPPAAPTGADRPPPRALRRPAEALALLLDPCAGELGVEAALAGLGGAPPGVADPAALLAARPTASGRALAALGAAPIPGGVRCRAAVPVDPGPPAWGPRAPGPADLLVFERPAGAGVEWLLRLE